MTWAEARNILCVRLDSLGDVLMTGPAIRALKNSVPGRKITLLTSQAGAEAAKLMPEVDEILVYDAPWLKGGRPRANAEAELRWIEHLQQHRFDGAVIFTVFSQNPLPSALFCHLAEIPLRLAHCRENPYQLLTDWVAESEPDRQIRHEVQRQLDLVASIGAVVRDDQLFVRVSETCGDQMLMKLVERGIEIMRPWAVMHPGASAPSRRYSVEGFIAVAHALIQDHGFQVVLTGTLEERELVDAILTTLKQRGMRAHSLAGELDVEELAALLSLAPVLISNNTGTVHLAAACETPVVDLYALTNPQHTPWKVRNRVLFHDVECRYCYKSVCPKGNNACLTGIAPDAVVRATLDLVPGGARFDDILPRVRGSL